VSHIHDLHYAPRPTATARLLRGAYWLVAALGIAAAGWLWGPGFWRWGELLYWQRRCLTHSWPPNHIVFEWSAAPPRLFSEQAPEDVQFKHLLGCWQLPNPTIFVHEMHSPDGARWIASVSVHCSMPGAILDVVKDASQVNSRTIIDEQSEISDDAGFRARLKIFGGQLDPHDPTHMTFEYVNDARQDRIVDGWMLNGGHLLITPRP